VNKQAFSPAFFKASLAHTPLGLALDAGPLVFAVRLTDSSRPIAAGLAPVLLPLEELTTTVANVERHVCTLKGVDSIAGGVRQGVWGWLLDAPSHNTELGQVQRKQAERVLGAAPLGPSRALRSRP